MARNKVLFKGDSVTINTDHGLCQPQGATAGQPAASRFIDFINSEKGQKIISSYGKDMYNDAEYAKKYEH